MPTIRARTTMARLMLKDCPVNLIVPREAAANPKSFFSTEPMMALVLGEEKSP